MNTENRSDPTIWIACRKCGHERRVTRDDLISGRWREQRCPVCRPSTSDDREEPADAAEH